MLPRMTLKVWTGCGCAWVAPGCGGLRTEQKEEVLCVPLPHARTVSAERSFMKDYAVLGVQCIMVAFTRCLRNQSGMAL